jgi:diguanylate cyclase (GGDEF)-like protein/PAS domain S-box-containing protein
MIADESSNRRGLYVWVSVAAAVIGLVLSVSACLGVWLRENRLEELELSARANSDALILQNGVNEYLAKIAALRALFQSSDTAITRREFTAYSELLLRDQTAIRAVSWIPRITRANRAAHELAAVSEGLPGYRIKSEAADGGFIPSPDANEYFPIFYSSKETPGSSLYGLDLNDGGLRQRTLERARDRDEITSTPNIVLHRGDGDRNGFFVVLPIYRSGLPHDTVDERRNNLVGFVQGAFQTGVLFETILRKTMTPKGLDLYFFAADSGADALPLYFHPSHLGARTINADSWATLTAGPHWTKELSAGDKRWTFVAAPTPGGLGTDHFGAWMALTSGLLVSWIVVAYIWTSGRRSLAARASAAQQVREANARLRDAIDILPQGIVFLDPEGRYILWNQQYAEIYKRSSDLFKPGAKLADTLRTGGARGDYPDAIWRKEEWLAQRLALLSNPGSRHEQRLADGRCILIEERRTSDGGTIGLRVDITEMKQREESFRLLFDANPVPMWINDRENLRILAVNDAALEHYGYSREEFLGMTVFDVNAAEERDELCRLAGSHQADFRSGRTWRHLKKDGGLIEVAIFLRQLKYQDRAAAVVALIDLTDRKRAEDEVRRTRELLDKIIENVPATIILKNADDRRYAFINRAGERRYALPRSEIIGKTAHDLLPKETADRAQRYDDELLKVGTPQFWDDHEFDQGQGNLIVNSTKLLISDEQGKPQYLLGVINDVTERRRAEERIAYMAYHDTLTDLPNRASFNERLADTIERATATNERFAILSLDFDRFKEINDLFGHPAGDALLGEIAKRLKALTHDAFVARIGGDEFMLISATGPQPQTAAALAARIRSTLSAEIDIEGQPLRTGVTIGVAVFPSDAREMAALISNADAALYRAKAEQRGSICFFEAEMDERLRERRALQLDLKVAIERRDLVLHYQPQARIDGSIVGFEALVRWSHATRGMVPPVTFIPLAEESGMIMPMGEWILREACREAASWQEPLQIAVNLSPIQFRHGDLPGLVHSVLLETGLAPDRLELEITEGVLIGDFSRAGSILRRLKSLGVRIAMDDFGTGYSSLSYLQSFPFDKLKIDQTFISNLKRNHQSAKIVRAVINLGQQLEMPVLAEGVETEEQLAFLKGEACSEIQGYLLGRPGPIEQYADIVGRAAPQVRKAAKS